MADETERHGDFKLARAGIGDNFKNLRRQGHSLPSAINQPLNVAVATHSFSIVAFV